MIISFSKYHGAGNDFVLVDNRAGEIKLSQKDIALLCDRHFGIGADGLMCLESPAGDEDFFMRYYNSDGRESTMCGNGGRCITAFADRLWGDRKEEYLFRAVDGLHRAEIRYRNGDSYIVRLKMKEVTSVNRQGDDYLLDTGSPHFVRFTGHVDAIDMVAQARAIRYNEALTTAEGANINYVQAAPDGLHIRTYERGVEDETLACGTGAVAAAIAACYRHGGLDEGKPYSQTLHARGGVLHVDFRYHHGAFTDIFLTGPAVAVFDGTVEI